MQVIQVYLDQPLVGGIISWIQDSFLLWMVAQIVLMKARVIRYILGGLVGGIFMFFMQINILSNGFLNQWVLSPFLYVFIIPFTMVGITFFPFSFKGFFKAMGYMYLLSFLLAGFHWGVDIINARYFHYAIALWWRFIFHITAILLIGELGWGVVHRKIWEQICLYPIQIRWGNHELKLNALLDTGNRLHDPLTKVPVIIVEMQQIQEKLPQELVGWMEDIQAGEIDQNFKLPDFWEERIRILPFNSIGNEHGIMIGFRPDQVRVWQKQQSVMNENVVIGLYNKPLSREGAFHALIPPAILRN